MHAFPSSLPHSFLLYPARSRKSSSGASAIQMIIPSGLLISVSQLSQAPVFFQWSQRPWRGLLGVLAQLKLKQHLPLLPHCISEAFALGGPWDTEELGFFGRQTHRRSDSEATNKLLWVRGCRRVPGTLSVPYWCFSPAQMQRVLS